jgi:hypothetical protein
MVHTDLLPGLRGKSALEAAREAMALMFLETNATTLWTVVPGHNRAAAAFTCMMGFEFRFVRERLLPMGGELRDARFYSRTIENWIESGVCADKGELFHVKLPKKFHTHAEDATHNAYVGAVLTMAKKQPEKAVRIYNRQARFAFYQQVRRLPTRDSSVLVDAGPFLIRVRGDDFDIEEKHQ